MTAHEIEIAKALLATRDQDKLFWHWLIPGRPFSQKDANKFFLGCILDYQIRSDIAWNNAKRLAEQILNDPEDLWGGITAGSLEDWKAKWKEYSIHRFPKAHERVFTIGMRVVTQCGGDARNIWDKQTIETVLYRLGDLRVGEQISRMIAGALFDADILQGKSDVKADIHVRRVLGRLVLGEEISVAQSQQAIDLARRMHAENPWLLDRPLYRLGKSICSPRNPGCAECVMRTLCQYAIAQHGQQ